MRPRTHVIVFAIRVTALCVGALMATTAAAQSLPPQCTSFTDATLDGAVLVKAVHISELRACINALRSQLGLGTYSWTDPDLAIGVTSIKSVHITQLRSALDEVYGAASQTAPTYTDAVLTTGVTMLKRAHILELRSAAQALALPLAAAPTFSPPPGTFNIVQTILISTSTSGATIRYTTDGTEPTVTSTIYTGGVSIDAFTTLKARAFRHGYLPNTATGTFVMEVATPSLSPQPGFYTLSQSIALATSTPNAALRYTLDGADPTENSALYSSSIVLFAPSAQTLKVKGFRTGWNSSAVAGGLYTMNQFMSATPTASPGTGTYEIGQVVTLSNSEPFTTIRYTTNGAVGLIRFSGRVS